MIFAEFAAPPLLPAPRPGRVLGRRKGLILTRDSRGKLLYRLPPGTPVPALPPAAPRAAVICARQPEPPPRCAGGRLFWKDSFTVCCTPR